MKKLTIPKPDDYHIHLREGAHLATTVAHAAKQFVRAIVMPNLKSPVTSVKLALTYREHILKHVPDGLSFTPLMTLYLTDQTTVQDITAAKGCEHIYACKLYPAGATTHAQAGVTQLNALFPVFAAMEKYSLPLLIHGEVTDPDVDIFDREQVFIDKHLTAIRQQFPSLPIVLEHITTKVAVDYILAAPNNVAATITAHHLLLNRNDLLSGGIKPHYYCLPIVKTHTDQQALQQAATSGNPKFFLGTDSAPHPQAQKESACGCAGIYTAHAAIELYAQVFDAMGALDKLAAFASFYGADFYHLARNQSTITLQRNAWQVPDYYTFADAKLIPFAAGQTLTWQT